jgi:hypothetical protein
MIQYAANMNPLIPPIGVDPCRFKRWLMPGCWEDTDGAAHFAAPEIHDLFGIPNTPEEITDTMNMLEQILREKMPDMVLIRRHHPSDKP